MSSSVIKILLFHPHGSRSALLREGSRSPRVITMV